MQTKHPVLDVKLTKYTQIAENRIQMKSIPTLPTQNISISPSFDTNVNIKIMLDSAAKIFSKEVIKARILIQGKNSKEGANPLEVLSNYDSAEGPYGNPPLKFFALKKILDKKTTNGTLYVKVSFFDGIC
jgi:hypothetical protein